MHWTELEYPGKADVVVASTPNCHCVGDLNRYYQNAECEALTDAPVHAGRTGEDLIPTLNPLKRRTQRRRFCALLAALCLCTIQRVDAWSVADIPQDWWGFVSGLGTGIVIHEAAHVLLADLKGYRVDNDGFSLVYPDAEMPPRDRLRIASAGMQAQWLATEFVFSRYRDESKLSNFAAGIVVSQLLVSAAYLTVLKNHRQGDIVGMQEATGWSRDQLAVTTALTSVMDGWRLSGQRVPVWLPHMSRASKGVIIGAIWTF